MKNRHFVFSNKFLNKCVEIFFSERFDVPLDAEKYASFHEFWYVKGVQFCTQLEYYDFNNGMIFGQDFKDLYDSQGWTGLEFGGPIVIHNIKKGLIQPQPYYYVKITGYCDKLIAHKREEFVSYDGVINYSRTNWEVVNENGFDFFVGKNAAFYICSHRAMKAIKSAKFTNFKLYDLFMHSSAITSWEDPDVMEI